ncbi:hypothetical protein EK21DRAFT_117999 [Setomelanomma holmii]|uniref:Uncharacterized protein n=1 Tax=Setomelanomma holmii TaxID=210430 RepID=A0A9P4LH47_9PLEO|nr:hypothetical protein EK21DRAFT_117999 [Setomelanomma holmii]
MSLVCTMISALELRDFQRIQGSREVYYESVTLSIWSVTEVAIGIVVASLPPLRKSFDGFFKHMISSVISKNALTGVRPSRTGFEKFNLPMYRSQQGRKVTDDDSDRAIVEDAEIEDGRWNSGFLRTTRISIDKQSQNRVVD